MDCAKCLELLEETMGRATPEVEAHLRGCLACGREARELRALAGCRGVPAARPSRDESARVAAEVWAAAERRASARKVAARGAGALAAAAAIAFVLVHTVWSPAGPAEHGSAAIARRPAPRPGPTQVAVSDTTAASLFVYGETSELAVEDYLDPHVEL